MLCVCCNSELRPTHLQLCCCEPLALIIKTSHVPNGVKYFELLQDTSHLFLDFSKVFTPGLCESYTAFACSLSCIHILMKYDVIKHPFSRLMTSYFILVHRTRCRPVAFFQFWPFAHYWTYLFFYLIHFFFLTLVLPVTKHPHTSGVIPFFLVEHFEY